MSDNAQPTGFSNGVSTPLATDLETLAFKSGLELNTTPSPINVSLGSANTGATDFKLVIASGGHLNGIYFVKVSVAGVLANVILQVSARNSSTKANSNNVVNVVSAETDDKTVILFKSAELPWGGTDVALVLNFYTLTAQTSVQVTVSGLGNKAPVDIAPYSLTWPNYTQPYTYHDVRDYVQGTPSRLLGSSPVNLDLYVKPTTISCNPASTLSKPSGTTGVGTVVVMASPDSSIASQMFVIEDGSIYTRYTSNGGSTWSAWNVMINENVKNQIIAEASNTALIWSIVMG